jgi:hypothetical protein
VVDGFLNALGVGLLDLVIECGAGVEYEYELRHGLLRPMKEHNEVLCALFYALREIGTGRECGDVLIQVLVDGHDHGHEILIGYADDLNAHHGHTPEPRHRSIDFLD